MQVPTDCQGMREIDAVQKSESSEAAAFGGIRQHYDTAIMSLEGLMRPLLRQSRLNISRSPSCLKQYTARRHGSTEASSSPSVLSNESHSGLQDLESASSLASAPASEESLSKYDPVARAKSRGRQLPPSRCVPTAPHSQGHVPRHRSLSNTMPDIDFALLNITAVPSTRISLLHRRTPPPASFNLAPLPSLACNRLTNPPLPPT